MGLRAIEGIDVDRARFRSTVMYRFSPSFQAGLEYNTKADDLGLIANWRALEETEARPALILGTSSDRIGTTDGRAVYATLSKSLEPDLGLPIAPYVGVSYGGSDEEYRVLGGMTIRYPDAYYSMHLYDGVNVHHIVGKTFDRGQNVGLMLVEQDGEHFLGVTVAFSAEWFRDWMKP